MPSQVTAAYAFAGHAPGTSGVNVRYIYDGIEKDRIAHWEAVRMEAEDKPGGLSQGPAALPRARVASFAYSAGKLQTTSAVFSHALWAPKIIHAARLKNGRSSNMYELRSHFGPY